MSALPLGRYRQLLHQLLQLNEQAAALRRELTAFVDTGLVADGAGGACDPDVADGAVEAPENAGVDAPEEMTGVDARDGDPLSDRKRTDGNPGEMRSEREELGVSPSSASERRSEFVQSDDDEKLSNPVRKPHFLDDDYHLKSDSSPKLHFLDDSPSPDDDEAPTPFEAVDREKTIAPKTERTSPRQKRTGEDGRDKKSTEEYPAVERRPRGELPQHGHPSPAQAGPAGPNVCQMYDCSWQIERETWQNQDSCSVKSFSSAGSGNTSQMGNLPQQLEQKVDSVYQLLSLLSLSADCNADMSEYLLEISNDIDSCITMRQSGCIPLLVQLVHSKHSRASRHKAAKALHNLIHAQPDNKSGRREVRVLRLLEIVREYCQHLEDLLNSKKENIPAIDDMSKHPVQSVAALMKLSFDEEHRHVMCQLGGLQSLASLVTVDQTAHGSMIEDIQCITMRKYSGMALTNLTFGDGNNKALLCSFKDFMISLVDQLQSPNEDMRQVTAAVLRNLSWRADSGSKQILREVGAVKGLTLAAMSGHKEATLKSVLSALWNLTAHCSLNKIDICSVDGALAFLVKMLSFDAPSKTLAIIENAGGILRNVSSHIAVREDYRQILRDHNCLKVLLQQLKSPSLTIVSNSCGTLWNLSARCQQDQQYLWDNGAVPMLRSLIHSKHKMIAMGSSAALKNLLNSKPGKGHLKAIDGTCRDLNLPLLPTLGARKQRALEQELDQNLSETCENIEPNTSPTTNNRDEKLILSAAEKHLAFNIDKRRMSSSSPLMGPLASQLSLTQSGNFSNYNNIVQNNLVKSYLPKAMRAGNVNRSDSKDSVTSTHSDSVYERVSRSGKFSLYSDYSNHQTKTKGSCNSVNNANSKTDNAFMKRYNSGKNPAANNVRTNYSDTGYDIEQFGCDQPIDYSQKYSETKTNHKLNSGLGNSNDSIDGQNNDSFSNKGGTVAYGDYQETDLDQPTDYSLRYAEDAISTLSDNQALPMHEDTIKHFCTEGTPYETPINFSTATSMSDLRTIPGIQSMDKSFKKNEREPTSEMINKENAKVMSQSDEKDTCSIEENTKHLSNDEQSDKSENHTLKEPTPNGLYGSKFSSGILSPEKPTNYCEEGTPGYFSRVSSLSSLEEIGDNGISKEKNWDSDKKTNDEDFTPKTPDTENKTEKAPENGLLGAPIILNYAEETPLMFSRCSSLGSISECSVPEQADDVGSVVSEFSRLTSGCISPSELPDSPTQSPVPRMDGPTHPVPMARIAKVIKTSHQPINRLRSVFEDEVSTFQCEHTPVEFSAGTSLSSLTIDDEPQMKYGAFDLLKRSDGVGCSNPTEIPKINNSSIDDMESKKNVSESLNDSEIESENILAMCIEVGIQSSIKPRNSKKNINLLPLSSSPIPDTNHLDLSNDACHTYYTEDTPAVLSKVGSQSNLSELSLLEIESDVMKFPKMAKTNNDTSSKKDYSDDSSNLSGESDHLLAECIRSGMPKASHPAYLNAEDELENYAIEGTPFRHSSCSSLSDLTIASKDTTARLIKNLDNDSSIKKHKPKDESRKGSLNGSLSSVSLGSDDDQLLDMAIRAGVPQQNDSPALKPKKKKHSKQLPDIGSLSLNDSDERSPSNLQRNDSISSLSDDSLGSNDGERALFEQCIKSGMPKVNNWDNSQTLDKNFKARYSEQFNTGLMNYPEKANKMIRKTESDPEFDNLVSTGAFSTCSRKFSRTKEKTNLNTIPNNNIHFESSPIMIKSSQHNPENDENSNLNNSSKNVQMTSVAASISNSLHVEASPSMATADIKNVSTPKDKETEERNIQSVDSSFQPVQTSTESTSKEKTLKEITILDGSVSKNSQCKLETKNGSDVSSIILPEKTIDTIDSIVQENIENDNAKVPNYNFVNLVDSDLITKNVTNDNDANSSESKPDKKSTDTWNDNTCPTDVSFPSISGSVPMVASFRSDLGDEITFNGTLPDLLEESMIYNESHTQPDLTVDSTEIPHNLKYDDDNDMKFNSMSSSTIIENEATRLAMLVSRNAYDYSTFIPNGIQSLELENIKPPSQMGSLVSLTQSISGNWDDYHNENLSFDKIQNCSKNNHPSVQRKKSLPNGIMARKALGLPLGNQGTSESAENSFVSNLENIKPPADLNDVYDMDNSILSVASIVSEIADVDVERFRGFNFDLKQPINSVNQLNNYESSSIIIDNVNPPSLFDELSESTLEHNSISFNGYSNFSLTLQQTGIESDDSLPKINIGNEGSESSIKHKDLGKNKYLTAKQKRQMSKERYKTYVITADVMPNCEIKDELTANKLNENVNIVEDQAPLQVVQLSPKQKRQEDRSRYQTQTVNASDLSMINKMNFLPNIENSNLNSKAKKSLKQKRAENSERFQTRILENHMLSSNSSNHQDLESDSSTIVESSSDDYHAQLVKDATRAFDLLQKQSADDSFVDLDCETMSLISEDDAELNSLRMKTFTKSFRNYLPVIESPTAVDKCIVKNLKNINISNLDIDSEPNQLETDRTTANNNFNSFECDQNSGTESADQNQYSDCEIEIQHDLPVKPKITKPQNGLRSRNSGSGGSLNSDENAPKGVRGRKRSAYVSPYKRNDIIVKKGTGKTTSVLKNSKANTSKGSVGLNAKSQSMLKKPVNLVSKSSSPLKAIDKNQKVSKGFETTKLKNSQKANDAKVEPKPQPLIRQGTFVKEESTIPSPNLDHENISPVQNLGNSKLAKPGSIAKLESPSKVPLNRNRIQPIKTIPGKEKNSDTKTTAGQTSGIPKSSPSKLKYSSSNQSLQSNESTKTIILPPKGKCEKKSNGNASNESITTVKQSTKNATSRVSSLWKKVEESKKLQAKPDTRVWIKCDSDEVTSEANNVKLIRSSTFEGPSKSSVNTPPKQKSSINLKVSQLPICKYTSKVPVKSTPRPSGL